MTVFGFRMMIFSCTLIVQVVWVLVSGLTAIDAKKYGLLTRFKKVSQKT